MLARVAALVMLSLAALALPQARLNAQTSDDGLSSEEIQEQTRRLQAEIRAAREAAAQREHLEMAMDDVRLDLAIIDDCLVRARHGMLIAALFTGGCYPLPLEVEVRWVYARVLLDDLKPEDAVKTVLKAVEESRRNVQSLRDTQQVLKQRLEALRQKWINVSLPSRAPLAAAPAPPPAPQSPVQPAANALGGCMIRAQNSCAYLTAEQCAGFKGQFCGPSATNPCHPVNGVNSC